MKMLRYSVILLVWFCVAAAQSPEGKISGTVSDQSGARISGATVTVTAQGVSFTRSVKTGKLGEFTIEALPPGAYDVKVEAAGFASRNGTITVAVTSASTMNVQLRPAPVQQTVEVEGERGSVTAASIESTSSVVKTTVGANDLQEMPLAHRSFANIAYLAPMTEPVEPSDPTKARITAVSFGGSSGLNVDLSVDGGDNNDDFIGGFLQNFSPDAMQEFTIRTAEFEADTSRSNGGSIIISTRRGSNDWHGTAAGYFRDAGLNARNDLDNPEPNPKQPFSRQNAVAAAGGPLVKDKLWIFSSLEYIHEDASVAYSTQSLDEFNALAHLASSGQIPGVTNIAVPSSVSTPFHDTLFSTRVDFRQSERSYWFLRGALDRNNTKNDLVHEGALPSTGFTTTSNYYSVLLSNQLQFSPTWIGNLVIQASSFHHVKTRNSNLGFGLAFPFSTAVLTTSGFETFGDNQFATPITAFPVNRDQQKYQFRYDVAHAEGAHAPKFGINLIHEPVLSGRISDNPETLFVLPQDPSFYAANPGTLAADLADPANQITSGGNGSFSQNVQRLGIYAEDSWRVRPSITLNYGLRYDTTFGLFNSNGADQNSNPAVETVAALNLALPKGVPHDYRKAFGPRVGFAYSPKGSTNTVFRAGAGVYFNDLAQNGWVDAFRAVSSAASGLLGAGDQGAIIDPNYHSPYAIQASAGMEHEFARAWRLNVNYEHQQGVHQYRRYEYVAQDPLNAPNATLPATAPDISVFRTDNRSRYDGVSFAINHNSKLLELTAHYTLAKATTWGANVGELFDYVNGVTSVTNPFGPGDHGPSGEDVRHRFVLAGTLHLPGAVDVSTLSQFESARPYTLGTGVDVNSDGVANDRAVINGQQTTLDEFRGTPLAQVDMRVSRNFKFGDHVEVRPFVEFFNLLNRQNPGNNFVSDIGALPVPATEVAAGNVTHVCLNADCSAMRPITSLNDLKKPGGALGDFFGPGTTVGMPFAAQFGIRLTF
ncbi:MAG TPA: carboxypeptidase regulatory-like domain-containing protein [Candidatus Angelobacter sp.]|nr:carboxypeptidase regulatory-like domain-containing protein [Candidatus Angelobacter sp.]